MSVVPGIASGAYKRHIQRRGQRTMEVHQFDQTCSILRYNQTVAGNPAAGIAPTVVTSTPALSGLACSVSEIGQEIADVREEIVAIEHDLLRFAFLDIPATTAPAVAANTLLLTDFILFEGEKFRIHHLGNEIESNETEISWCIARLWVRA